MLAFALLILAVPAAPREVEAQQSSSVFFYQVLAGTGTCLATPILPAGLVAAPGAAALAQVWVGEALDEGGRGNLVAVGAADYAAALLVVAVTLGAYSQLRAQVGASQQIPLAVATIGTGGAIAAISVGLVGAVTYAFTREVKSSEASGGAAPKPQVSAMAY